MVMYVNEFKTKEKPKLTEIKINCNIYIANKFNLTITGVTIARLYKKDTSLRRSANAVPEGCVRQELTSLRSERFRAV